MRSEERAQMARPVLENDSMQLEPQRRRGQFLITQGNHMSLIAHANSHNFLYKIGDGENVVTELTRQHLDRTTTPRASES